MTRETRHDDDSTSTTPAPTTFEAAVAARALLLERARRVLPKDYAFEGKSDRQVHEDMLAKAYGCALTLSGKSDSYVRGRYEYAAEGGRFDAADPPTALPQRKFYAPEWTQPLKVSRQDAAHGSQRDEPHRPAWEQPLAVNADR